MQTARVQLKHILCPTDFSEFSARALRHAVALARQFDARVTVLHVIEDLMTYGAALPHADLMAARPTAVLRKQTTEELARFVEPALLDRVQVSHLVQEGVPWREIRALAETLPCDLLVMGTHGRRGFERLVLGSVAEKVLQGVACPVLTVCHEEGRTWQAPGLISRILCATDLSATSQATIDFALSLATEKQAHVTFLNVIEELPDGGYLVSFRNNLAQALRQRLHDAIPEDARSWCEIEERVEAGRAHLRILQAAVEERADIIVIGGHAGRSPATALFGSTARHVVREATSPVLSVRPPGRTHVAASAAALALADVPSRR